MKNIILSIAVLLASAVLLPAQRVEAVFTSAVIPASGSVTSQVATVTVGERIALDPSFRLTGAGTSGVGFLIDASNDATTWSTTQHQFWMAANGTATVTTMTNFDIGAAPFLRIRAFNTNSVAVTNMQTLGIVRRFYR